MVHTADEGIRQPILHWQYTPIDMGGRYLGGTHPDRFGLRLHRQGVNHRRPEKIESRSGTDQICHPEPRSRRSFLRGQNLQDTYHSRIIMSEADWTAMAKSNDPNELKAKKDMVATDGMKLTLGDTTLTLYITPGHTQGTISTLVPLKDGNQRHVGAVWGGINPDMGRNGVRYFANMEETFKTWSASAKRFQDIAAKANADVYLTLHPFYDKALDKLHALNFRKPGGPHPFVSKDNLNRFLTIIRECTEAQLARISS